jgi:hypothetical protein
MSQIPPHYSNKSNSIFYSLGDALVSLLGLMLFIPTFCFWLNLSLTNNTCIIVIIIPVIFTLFANRYQIKFALSILGLLTILIITTYYISNLFYDTSWDGWSYHQPATIAIMEGWNPIKQPNLKLWWESIKAAKEYKLVLDDLGSNFIWVTHYAKASWVMSATVGKLTGNIESAKFINLLAIFATFFNAYKLFKSFNVSIITACLFALIYAANVIAISQFSTAYNDGLLGSFYGILLSSSILWIKNNKLEDAINIFFSSLILINIKFSGAIYTMILFAMLLTGIFLFRKHAIYRTIVLLGICFVVNLFISYNPYIYNLKDFGHPFYPVNPGNKQYDIMFGQAAPDFLQKNRFIKFIWSTYAKVDNSGTELPKIKIPLTISSEERELFKYLSDTRYSGFGVLFGFIFSVFCISGIIFRKDILKNKDLRLLSLSIAAIIISTILFPESWWARYVPQLWYGPVLLSFSLMVAGRLFSSFFLGLIIFINTAIICVDRISLQHETANLIKKSYLTLFKQNNITIHPFIMPFSIPIIYRAAQHNVHFKVSKKPINCKPTADSHFQICD